MSVMIERAAKALFEFPYEEDEQPDVPWTGDDSEGDATVARGQARAALLAALDPENEDLCNDIGCELAGGGDEAEAAEWANRARHVIRALNRSIAEYRK